MYVMLKEHLLEVTHQVVPEFAVEWTEVVDCSSGEKGIADQQTYAVFELSYLLLPADLLQRQYVRELVGTCHAFLHQLSTRIEGVLFPVAIPVLIFELLQVIFDLVDNETSVVEKMQEACSRTSFSISCLRARLLCMTPSASLAVFNFSSFGFTVR